MTSRRLLDRPERRAGRRPSPTGCSRNWNEVTTPKLPPPPRSAQNRSGFSSALACTSVPSASTTSASSRLSIVRPYLRVRWPMPPPSVSPPTPVVEMIPHGVARPARGSPRSTSPQVRRRRRARCARPASTSMPRSATRSMTTPSSQMPRPPPLCPPPRTASSRSCRRAKLDRRARRRPASRSGRSAPGAGRSSRCRRRAPRRSPASSGPISSPAKPASSRRAAICAVDAWCSRCSSSVGCRFWSETLRRGARGLS